MGTRVEEREVVPSGPARRGAEWESVIESPAALDLLTAAGGVSICFSSDLVFACKTLTYSSRFSADPSLDTSVLFSVNDSLSPGPAMLLLVTGVNPAGYCTRTEGAA